MALPGVRVAVVPFVTEDRLEAQLDEFFSLHYAAIHDAGITLSMYRKAKRRLLEVTLAAGLDLSTLALALCALDSLLRAERVDKRVFKVVCTCCLYLAAKFNEMLVPAAVRALRERLARQFQMPPAIIAVNEFHVYNNLSFALFRDPAEVMPYFEAVSTLADEYLSDHPEARRRHPAHRTAHQRHATAARLPASSSFSHSLAALAGNGPAQRRGSGAHPPAAKA